MLITDAFIFLELRKCGSSYTRELLYELSISNEKAIIGKHNAPKTLSSKFRSKIQGKLMLGNIRNPWDWYVSVWAFGCLGKGTLYHNLMQINHPPLFSRRFVSNTVKSLLYKRLKPINPKLWKRLYSDPYDVKHFREWLNLILSDNGVSIGEFYKEQKKLSSLGFLTFRLFRLYSDHRINTGSLQSFEDISKSFHSKLITDHIFKLESLHKELLKYESKLNIDCSRLSHHKIEPNESIRHSDYRKYYDSKTTELVSVHEKIILDKFNYSFHTKH